MQRCGKYLGKYLAFALVVLSQSLSNCISGTLSQAILQLQPESDHEALVTNFLNSLGERQRNLLTPLCTNEDVDGLQQYIQRRRQELLDLLREFNVPSVPAANEASSMMINVARHTLLEIPINAMQVGHEQGHLPSTLCKWASSASLAGEMVSS